MTSARRPAPGFILLPLLLLLALVASLVVWTQHDASLQLAQPSRSQDFSRAELAAQAGLEHLTRKIHQSGCSSDYPTKKQPLRNDSFGTASYTAYAEKDSDPPGDLTAIGTQGSKQVTLTRSQVRALQTTDKTLILQPDEGGTDTTIALSGSTDAAPGNAPQLTLNGQQQAGLLKFDLSLLPNGAEITSARLVTRALTGSGSGVVSLYRAQSGWNERATTATRDGNKSWASSPGDPHPTALATANYNGGLWLEWDITALAERWVSANLPNFGVMLQAGSGISNLTLASSDHGAPGLRPRLIVTLKAPCEWKTPRQTITYNAVADTYISSSDQTKNFGSDLGLIANNFDYQAHILIRFEPLNLGRVKSARVRLNIQTTNRSGPLASDVRLWLYDLRQTWQESGATWIRRDSDSNWWESGAIGFFQESTGTVNIPKGSDGGTWVEFSIDDSIIDWIKNSGDKGIALASLYNVPQVPIFFSRESTLHPPELVVEYEGQ